MTSAVWCLGSTVFSGEKLLDMKSEVFFSLFTSEFTFEPGTKPVKTKQTVIDVNSWTYQPREEEPQTLSEIVKENRTQDNDRPGQPPKNFVQKMNAITKTSVSTNSNMMNMLDKMRQMHEDKMNNKAYFDNLWEAVRGKVFVQNNETGEMDQMAGKTKGQKDLHCCDFSILLA